MPDDRPAAFAAILHRLAVLVEGLDEDGLHDLVSGRRALILDAPPTPPQARPAGSGSGHVFLGPAPPARAAPAQSPHQARRPGPTSRSATGRRPTAPVSAAEATEVRGVLLAMASRAEAHDHLDRFGTIPRLTSLADALRIPHLAKENRERLIRKIIDATVGARLSDRAMQGDSPLLSS
ncbi:hypothetical protein [Frankia sp. QA3]|uniref:hypothetical protein n=1 Tax=Frankia sp. QA3 TaxID=710111 RepID=UPI000269CE51|nr:hypothetical protein [Frankia sp. QA3]EIV96188.1 hypothetical protein FraQA3DRAFT_6057 [Frankia sp. QA3]